MRASIVLLLLAAAAAAPRGAAALENSDCFACHGDKDLKKDGPGGQPISLFIDEAKFGASIHAKNLCTSCHSDVTELPHPDNFTHKPVSCGACHRVETDIYLKSDHGQALQRGVVEAATCKACHGNAHELLGSRNPASPVNRANVPETCARCHGNAAEMAKYGLKETSAVKSYLDSVHGRAHARGVASAATCSDCHGTHDLHRATNPQSKLYWQTIPQTCGKCHENVLQTYGRSVHGTAVKAGLRDAATCVDCHGEHGIQAPSNTASRVSSAHIPETCAQCHGSERIASRYQLSTKVVETYMQSFHGLAQQFTGLTVANCASCHGFHDILPPDNPLSSVNRANLPQTCGKCHTGIGTRLAKGEIKIHELGTTAQKDKPWLANLVTRLYVVLIVLVIGGMFAFVAIDYGAKTRKHIRAAKAGHGELRMTRWVKAQHTALTILFLALVYTGFVHRFPEAFYSWPFRALASGGALRSLLHRIAGWTFSGLFLVHLVALFCTKRGRAYLDHLKLRVVDGQDALAQLLFNVGLRKTPPPHRKYDYIEKAEYWALVWGSFVMVITGILLVFTESVLRTLPKIWIDIAQIVHFYEALLASLAILVWHFYWSIFDPRVYPMNPSWIVGRRARPTDDHGAGEASAPPPEPAAPAKEEPPVKPT